jgi:hypothetical protein
MNTKQADSHYSPAETEERREAALKRMLSTPPQPRKPLGKKRRQKEKRSRTLAKPK